MDRQVNIYTDNVTIVNNSGWNKVTNIDFGGAEVEFKDQTSYYSLFSGNTTITSITNGTITNKYGYCMFSGCSSLTTFDMDLPNIDDCNKMFYACRSLTAFNVDMPSNQIGTSMFQYCSSLTTFDSDMPNLTNANSMFQSCSSLTTFDSDMPNLTNANSMFQYCSSLRSFTPKMQNLEDGDDMFLGCQTLSSFVVDFPKLTSGKRMFARCIGSYFNDMTGDLSSLENGSGMCSGSSYLKTFSIDMPKLTNSAFMFSGCVKLSSFTSDLRGLTSIGSKMFGSCTSLTNVEMTVKGNNSGWTQSSFSIPSTAPCNQYKYVDKMDSYGTLMKLTFTNEYWDVVDGDDVVYIEDGGRYRLNGSYSTFQLQPQNTSLTSQTLHLTLTNRNVNAYELNIPCRVVGNNDYDYILVFWVEPFDIWEGDVTMHTDDGFKWVIDSAVRTN